MTEPCYQCSCVWIPVGCQLRFLQIQLIVLLLKSGPDRGTRSGLGDAVGGNAIRTRLILQTNCAVWVAHMHSTDADYEKFCRSSCQSQ